MPPAGNGPSPGNAPGTYHPPTLGRIISLAQQYRTIAAP